jgi:Protein of unknown function (DUF1588)/Protein of unknown function (DUF1592)/Protein of unknown function (DUF1585)
MTLSAALRRFGLAVAVAHGCHAILPSHASAQTPVATFLEETYQAANPELYAVAKQYFPNATAAIPQRRIFRLTRDQIDATVVALLPAYAPPSIKAAIPRDALQTNYEYAEILSLNAANTSGIANWAADIAARVRKKPAGVIDCAEDGGAADCRAKRARAFVVKAFRGDVSEDKILQFVTFYLAAVKAAGAAQAAGDLVEVVLNSPGFLFRREVDVNGANRLTPAQLLSAVTYTIADQPPEALGLQSEAAANYLKSGVDAGATIAAALAAKSAREKLARFFVAWLEIKEPGEFTISPKLYPEFSAKLETAVRDEAQQFLALHLSRPSPSLKDITQGTTAILSPALAPVYGIEALIETAGKPVEIDPTQRLGIFSKPAFIASHSGPTDTRPIKRGVFWVRKAMCMEMEPPPKDLHAKLYDLAGATERQRIEQSTSGAACSGCHKVINPFAFFQENYDALGRWRTRDNGAAIDASILIDFLDEEPTKTSGPVDALKVLTNSAMFKQCFVRQLFRFYMGRSEEPGDDPLLRRMFFEFADQDRQDIVKALQTLVSSDRIVRRR